MPPTVCPRLPAAAALLLAWLATASPLHAQTLTGPPTFETGVQLDIDRGGGFPLSHHVANDSTYKSRGQQRSTGGADPVYWYSGPPSVADAEASDQHLRATARAQGTVLSQPGGGNGQVIASAWAQTTRFFDFASDFTLDDIPVLLDGQLGGHIGYAELPALNQARMHHSLTLLDASGSPLGTVFSVTATVRHVGGNQFITQRSVGGWASAALWEAAFSAGSLFNIGFGGQQGWDVGYIEDVDTPLVARAGGTYGFRWRLEAEAQLQGQSLAGDFLSGFGHTATIGLGRSSAELAALGITELLTMPAPVPEPATLLLWLGGLAGLATWRRRRGPPAAAR